MVKLQYTETAIKDLKSIHDFIAANSNLYAKRFVSILRQQIAVLKQHPQAGYPFNADKFKDLRQLLVKSYRIIYHFQNDKVTVLVIQHQSKQSDTIVTLDPFIK